MANIPLDQAHGFLTNVAENTGGQKIPTKANNGVLFAFPHSQNALDELSKNAENWAKAQNQQLQEQMEKQQKILQMMQLRQAAAQQQVPAKKDPDPWTATGQPGL
jgi:ABC-type Fe3+-hydroxamate transport system substrate-binding protein